MSEHTSRLASILFDINLLKRIPRSGWLLRGVGPADTESVAEHTYGTALTALFLADHVTERVDRGRLLTICLLHDLPETQILDLTPDATRLLGSNSKHAAEEQALTELLSAHPSFHTMMEMWREYQAEASAEARLARDADKLDMMTQAAAYERAGARGLDEYWNRMGDHRWNYPISRALFLELVAQRRQARATIPNAAPAA